MGGADSDDLAGTLALSAAAGLARPLCTARVSTLASCCRTANGNNAGQQGKQQRKQHHHGGLNTGQQQWPPACVAAKRLQTAPGVLLGVQRRRVAQINRRAGASRPAAGGELHLRVGHLGANGAASPFRAQETVDRTRTNVPSQSVWRHRDDFRTRVLRRLLLRHCPFGTRQARKLPRSTAFRSVPSLRLRVASEPQVPACQREDKPRLIAVALEKKPNQFRWRSHRRQHEAGRVVPGARA
jgi:hypothetical protein